MSELKKAKYLGGIGAILILVGTLFFLEEFLENFFLFWAGIDIPFQGVIGIFGVAFGFIFVFLAIKRMGKVLGEEGMYRDLLRATFSLSAIIPAFILSFILGIVFGFIVAVIVGLLFPNVEWGKEKGTNFLYTLFFLSVFISAIVFSVAMFFISRALKKTAEITGQKLFFLAGKFILFASFFSIISWVILTIIGVIILDYFGEGWWRDLFEYAYQEGYKTTSLISLFFISFGFFLLAIAFFTLPESLPQNPLTGKKEV